MARNYGVLHSCWADVDLDVNSEDVGGLVGFCGGGQITQCCSIGKVEGNGCNGGLIGRLYEGQVYACYSTCDVSRTAGDYSGGLVGKNDGDILACYSTGCIIERVDTHYSGGLVGENNGTISQCYSIEGLVGDNNGSVEYSYWDMQAGNMTTSDAGQGLTTAQMLFLIHI